MGGGVARVALDQPLRTKQDAEKLIYQHQQDRNQAELRAVLNTDAGQALILRILDECHVYADAVLDKAAQGRRQVGIRLIHAIRELGPDSYPRLLLNHAERMQRYREEEDGIRSRLLQNSHKTIDTDARKA